MSKMKSTALAIAAMAAMFESGAALPPEPIRTKPKQAKPATLSPKVWAHLKKLKRMYRDSRKHSHGKK